MGSPRFVGLFPRQVIRRAVVLASLLVLRRASRLGASCVFRSTRSVPLVYHGGARACGPVTGRAGKSTMGSMWMQVCHRLGLRIHCGRAEGVGIERPEVGGTALGDIGFLNRTPSIEGSIA